MVSPPDNFSLTPRPPLRVSPAPLPGQPSRAPVTGGGGTLLEIGGDNTPALMAPAGVSGTSWAVVLAAR